jgi:hypothetical protein
MDNQPSATARGCAFGIIALAIFGGGMIVARLLEVLF